MNSITPTLKEDAEAKSPPNRQAWYRPLVSPEHGVYVVLLVSFLTGTAAAQQWNWATTLALICAFCGFQAEHPLVLQLKQRRSFKPRFLVWGGFYGGIALTISLYLALTGSPHTQFALLGIYLGAITALIVDGISVWMRSQKTILNELVTFAAVCLCAPFAYTATTGEFSAVALALWAMNALFFSSTIFTVKLRKSPKDEHSLAKTATRAWIYHAILPLLATGLYGFGLVSLLTASAMGVVLFKFGLIVWQQDWYRTAPIKFVAMLETFSALLFGGIVAISVLPAHLQISL
jgi:YwiC-like protein